MPKYMYQYTNDAGSKIFGLTSYRNGVWIYAYRLQGLLSERPVDYSVIKSVIHRDSPSLTPFRLEFIYD